MTGAGEGVFHGEGSEESISACASSVVEEVIVSRTFNVCVSECKSELPTDQVYARRCLLSGGSGQCIDILRALVVIAVLGDSRWYWV